MQEHKTVLLEESVQGLNLKPEGVAVDATAGQGGHAKALASIVGKGGTVLILDADEESLAVARAALRGAEAHLIYVHGNFRNLREHAERAGVSSADAIIFDLGWHAGQLTGGRGFSFREDAPLLMTLSAHPEPHQLTAADIIGNWNENDLATLFRELGGERFSGRIARAIVEERSRAPITSSSTLADVVRRAVPAAFRNRKIHPATRVFQALRIRVNDELEALKEGLLAAIELLAPGARVAVITFQSLEDRIVKNIFRTASDVGRGRIITKKPVTPTRKEVMANPRSRSAKLRIFEKYV